jgi:ribosomal protein S18 acetylase RimI-like enzyme
LPSTLPSSFIVRPLEDDDRVNRLKLRTEDGVLGAFLKNHSRSWDKLDLAKTHVLVDGDEARPQKVVGYISLVVAEIHNELVQPDDTVSAFKHPYPCVIIGRLAVDLRLRRMGGGRMLVDFTIALVKRQLMPWAGCRFLVLDANKPAIEFYKRQGFTLVDTVANKERDNPVMFMDLRKL